jgi:hypothetical protein
MVPHWLDTLTLDVRYALRTLKNSPGFATVATLSLAPISPSSAWWTLAE